jgi:DNA-binding transcriptional regulator GbsR (MarR family)
MVEIGPNARKVYDVLVELGAKSPDVLKSADQIMEKARMGKGQVNSALAELQKKKVVDRIARQKRAGYYVKKEV